MFCCGVEERVRRAKIYESSSRLPVALIQETIAAKSLTQPEHYLHPGLHITKSGGLFFWKKISTTERRYSKREMRKLRGGSRTREQKQRIKGYGEREAEGKSTEKVKECLSEAGVDE